MSKIKHMRLFLPLLTLTSLCLLYGCGTTVNRTQIVLSPPPPVFGRTNSLSQGDYTTVLQILKATAKDLRLSDRTASSMVPGTLVFYQGEDTDEPMKLVAWKQADQILIDFFHTPTQGLGEDLSFRDAREKLQAELEMAFGSRISLVPLGAFRAPMTGS